MKNRIVGNEAVFRKFVLLLSVVAVVLMILWLVTGWSSRTVEVAGFPL